MSKVKHWSRRRIINDLRKMKDRGETPNPYELKGKYGFRLLSQFFPLLYDVGGKEKDLVRFVKEIFDKVTDPRDLNYRFGPCHCPNCPPD